MIRKSLNYFVLTILSTFVLIGCANNEAMIKMLPNEIAQANQCKNSDKEFQRDCYELISYKNTIAMLRFGISSQTKGDYKDAFQKYSIAQNKGNFYANSLLADLYNKGNGVAKNQKKALALLQEVDDADPIAAYKLSFYYVNKKDYDEVMNLLIFAATNHVKKAQYELSKIYRDGLYSKDDPKKAKYWYEQYENKENDLIAKIYGL
jgi:TPR repeat protein